MTQEIENVIEAALRDFLGDLIERHTTAPWMGREHEAVSLFAFKHLIRYVQPAERIAIGAAVAPVSGVNKRDQVCKDLVIWPEAPMTWWRGSYEKAGNQPNAILEWKVATRPGRNRKTALDGTTGDLNWLAGFTKECRRPFVGYAVLLDLTQVLPALNAQKWVCGASEPVRVEIAPERLGT